MINSSLNLRKKMTTISRGSGKSPYSDKTLLENNDLKKKYETRYHELRSKFREIHSQQRFDNAKVSLLQLATASATAILPHFLCLKHSYSDYWGLYQTMQENINFEQVAQKDEVLTAGTSLVKTAAQGMGAFFAVGLFGAGLAYLVPTKVDNENKRFSSLLLALAMVAEVGIIIKTAYDCYTQFDYSSGEYLQKAEEIYEHEINIIKNTPKELELRAELVDFSFYSLLGFVATSALGMIGHYWVNSRAKNEVNNLLNSKEKKEFNELLEKKNKLTPKEPSKTSEK